MERKKLIGVGIAALLIVGLVWGIDAATQKGEEGCPFAGKGFRAKGKLTGEGRAAMFEKLELPEDATREEVHEAMFQKKLDGLGLTEDSSIRELKDAMYGHRLSIMREKLGLSEDATEEEIKDALGEKAFDRHKGFRKKMAWGM